MKKLYTGLLLIRQNIFKSDFLFDTTCQNLLRSTSGANLNMVGAYYAVSLYTNKSVFRYVNTYCILFSNGNMTELTGNTIATLVLYTL